MRAAVVVIEKRVVLNIQNQHINKRSRGEVMTKLSSKFDVNKWKVEIIMVRWS